MEIDCMRNRYIIDTLTSDDIQEITKVKGKVIEIYEGVVHRQHFNLSLFRGIIDKLFALGQKYKDKNIDVMQILVILILNSLYGEQLRENIEEKFACKSEK